MQVPNRRVRKMITELKEISERIWYVDAESAVKLEGMAAYFDDNFKANPTKEKGRRERNRAQA